MTSDGAREAQIRQTWEPWRKDANPVEAIPFLLDRLDKGRAEIARLRAVIDDLSAPTVEELKAQYADERLRAPVGADVTEIAFKIVGDYINRVGAYDLEETEFQQYENDLGLEIARALQQYGGERAAEARSETRANGPS